MRNISRLIVSVFAISVQPALADMVVTRELPDGNRVFFKCIGVCDAADINARIDRMRLSNSADTSVRIVTNDPNSIGSIGVRGVSNAVVAVALGQQNSISRVGINGANNLVRVVEQGRNNTSRATSRGENNNATINIYGANNNVSSSQSGNDMTTIIRTRGDGTTVVASQTDTPATNSASSSAASDNQASLTRPAGRAIRGR